MELIVAIFQAYSTAKEIANVYGSVSDWVVEKVNNWSKGASTATIERQVERMGKVTGADIQKAAVKVFGGDPKKLSPDPNREELVMLLTNMVRNVRAQSIHGPVDSSILRSEVSLGRILRNVEPKRHQHEPVAAGSPWVLKRHLGMGSFGEVWLAENPGYPFPRAYKFFTRDGSGDWLRRERESLVAVLKRLGEHDNIVDFEDCQVDGCQYPYLALEYCGGGSLEDWIIKDAGKGPPAVKSEIVRQIVTGLAAAHHEGIAHRDIKPANILLAGGSDLQIKIGDFGLAKVTRSTRDGASRMASLAGLVGTELYLPPEAQHRKAHRHPEQDDVFALGVVWYQLVLGAIERPPYDFASRLGANGLDSHTIGLIERCLAHPARRFADAEEVLKSLDNMIPGPIPCLPGKLDVQYLAIEYLSALAR